MCVCVCVSAIIIVLFQDSGYGLLYREDFPSPLEYARNLLARIVVGERLSIMLSSAWIGVPCVHGAPAGPSFLCLYGCGFRRLTRRALCAWFVC